MAQAKDILDAALKLEPAERARIAHEIILSLDDPIDGAIAHHKRRPDYWIRRRP
jgi:hypothetical protein